MIPTIMAELVDTLIEDDRWMDLDLETLAERGCKTTLTHLGLDPTAFEISLLGCDDTRIADLNRDFREKPTATNVLSWPSAERAAQQPGDRPELPEISLPGQPEELGDIAISYDTCVREAAQAGHENAAHVSHLMVHATLHLLGYDHISEQDAALMERTEVQILEQLGYPDPYSHA